MEDTLKSNPIVQCNKVEHWSGVIGVKKAHLYKKI